MANTLFNQTTPESVRAAKLGIKFRSLSPGYLKAFLPTGQVFTIEKKGNRNWQIFDAASSEKLGDRYPTYKAAKLPLIEEVERFVEKAALVKWTLTKLFVALTFRTCSHGTTTEAMHGA